MKADVPCKPSKLYGVDCSDCKYYDRFNKKILIIKLGAAGDVIRTTPLLYPLKDEYHYSKIFWLTDFPELLPSDSEFNVDVPLKFNLQSVLYLQETKFDVLINLDKDKEAIALASKIQAFKKFGYTLINGMCYPVTKDAEHKLLTGMFDEYSKKNMKSYLDEIFEICGFNFKKEKYLLDIDNNYDKEWDFSGKKKIVGLNTGCGSRWTSRLWKNEYWVELINKLHDKNYDVVLLGGEQEHENNTYLSELTNCKYFGHFNLKTFVNLVNRCDIVVTQVTMGLHIAIGLNKKVVLLNNIFNPNEFELYGNGIIVQPQKECKCYFSPKCTNEEYKCMDSLIPEQVFDSVNKLSI
ncbi:MAG: glycosyltransferase family 9 protein [Ignavibacteria bacterium]|nr:glycosyltransferase family 9 protein [Ignavibacteria bacterium]